jgi:hypothetical protein
MINWAHLRLIFVFLLIISWSVLPSLVLYIYGRIGCSESTKNAGSSDSVIMIIVISSVILLIADPINCGSPVKSI